MKKIKDVNDFNFKDKTVLLRVDYNVPINQYGKITDETRINYSLPTINKILFDKGKIVIISHFGRPKGVFNNKYSLKFLIPILSKKLKKYIFFCDKVIGNSTEEKIKNLKNGEIILLENLRFYKEEENGDKQFSYILSKYGDIYVNDAFGASHREHSSITILPKFFNKKCIGLLMKKEILNLSIFFSKKINSPITIILGGAKIESKINFIKNFMKFADYLLIGGGMSYPFIKIDGGNVGNSIIDNIQSKIQLIKEILYENKIKNIIYFPYDVIAIKSNDDNNIKIVPIHSIPNNWKGLDIGPNSIKNFCNIINKSKTILWNGPMGLFEKKIFSIGTISIAKAIIKRRNNAFTVVGGGDSILALKMIKSITKISYLSTGGGAMLEFIKNKTLPGINAISL
ncbi:phosphoglycerate kinase [Blattabacterium cuenoti]|uniref:phosphoglycerate kinase n=1 Tax=Blattabacterium cuenoti TaxID=1653831 RepID=UPI00163CE71D|nr:phosphoglycerate kinase [Blattabacterium cuenoti]